jgi:hypothetical protein
VTAAPHHGGQLQPDEREHHRLQDRVARLPDGLVLQPRRVAALGGVEAEIEPRHDDGEQAGGVQALGEQVDPERHEQAERALDVRVVEPDPDAVHQPAGTEPDGGTADRRQREHPRPLRHRDPGARGHRDEDAEQGQRGGVVDQALPAEDRHQPAGQAEPAADGQRGHRVRGRDDRAQHQAGGERQPRDDPGRDQPDGDGGERDQADGEQCDRPGVGADVAVGRVERRGVQQRREHHQQDHVRVERDRDHARRQRHHEAGGDQHQRGREPEPAAQRRDGQRAEDEGEEGERRRHGRVVLRSAVMRGRMAHDDLHPHPFVRRPRVGRAAAGQPGRLRRLHRDGRPRLGAPADVPDLRARRVLRLQPAPPRHRPPPRDRAPGHALVRAGRAVAVVLRGPADRLN